MDWRDAQLGGFILPGWEPLVDELHKKVLEIDPDVVVEQVKEKFGGLRYYFDTKLDLEYQQIENLVLETERKCLITCEVCGARGETVNHQGWLKTLCLRHTLIIEDL